MDQRRHFIQLIYIVLSLSVFACGKPNDKGDATSDKQESAQAGDWDAPPKDKLTAVELIELADCSDLPCVQLYIKDHVPDFFHATRGEFSTTRISSVVDTAGVRLTMPLSTFYVDDNAQIGWRAAHTVHTKSMADTLYNEFMRLDFKFADEGYYVGMATKQQRYVSKKYPGKSLYVTATFKPWIFKGLYKTVTWPCYVFEVYNDE